MTPELARLSARLYNSPLLVRADVAETLATALGDRLAGLSPLPIRADAVDGDPPDSDDDPYTVEDGVATIPVRGELVNRGSWLDATSGLTSYDGIKSALRLAASDPRVERVVLDVDSPGGEAAGALETADEIAALAKLKPVTAFVNPLAASAAYWLASAASEVVVTPMATVGSIGVVWMHLDRSKAMAAIGVKPTLLHSGAFKIDGTPMAPLADDARARIQAQIDDVYDLFTASVGAHRPKLGQDGAKATEAGLFMGEKAVSAGLADRVSATPAPPRARTGRKGPPMTLSTQESGVSDAVTAPAAQQAAPVSPPLDVPNPEAAMADALALEAAQKTGADEATARISAILDCDEAKGREKLARHFAFKTTMGVDDVKAALALAAVEAAATPGSRMAQVPTPNVGADSAQTVVDAAAQADAHWSHIAKKLNASLPRGAVVPADVFGRI